MFNRLRRFFSGKVGADEYSHDAATEIVTATSARSKNRSASDLYFGTMAQLQEAIAKHEFERAARFVRENLRQLPKWINDWRLEYGRFDIRSIPALDQGGTILALAGDDDGLAEMRQIVESTPDLKPWADEVTRHAQDRQMFKAIVDAITAHPNCLQTDIKNLICTNDGHRVATLISYLEKAGRIARIREGRTYRLMLSRSPEAPAPPPKAIIVGSHKSGRQPPPLREIDISSLTYIPLPRSPLRSEGRQANCNTARIPASADTFEVGGTADWRIVSIEKVSKADRPDPAFRHLHPNGIGMLMIDDLGKADGLGHIESAALQYDRSGRLMAKVGFPHGIYRLGVHPRGGGLIAMSKECVIHSYGERLDPLFQTALSESPEIVTLKKRIGIQDDKLKNHIRCVALSRDATRYLFTAVDEAWCIDSDGKGLWGTKLPLKEGWARAGAPSNSFATSTEVDQALAVMALSLPITPEDVKLRYRQLAKEWHPDLHPDDPQAEEKMKALTAAGEVLTGVNANSLSHYAGATFVHEIGREKVDAGGVTLTMSFSMHGNEAQAADWIYAASFAARTDSVYLAGYSGRVVLVDENGKGVRVYDIGSVPRRIVDTGDYLYLLTDTRLYVLHDEALHAIVDTVTGDLLVAQTGFGLLEKNRLRWFFNDGTYLGSVTSIDPIRRVYSSSIGMVVETRQRRALIQGVTNSWE